jgi:hypothetical protein
MRSYSSGKTRSVSAQRPRYNPIIPSEQPVEVERSGRASVQQSFYYSKYPLERPKGKTKTQFSKNSERTFHIAAADIEEYKPSIRVNIPQNTHGYQRPQSIRTGYKENLGVEKEEKLGNRGEKIGSPSPILKYENERRYCLPSDMGIKRVMVGPGTKSSVFEDSKRSYLFGGRFKSVLKKESDIGKVLGYEFALPYRDEKITPKP